MSAERESPASIPKAADRATTIAGLRRLLAITTGLFDATRVLIAREAHRDPRLERHLREGRRKLGLELDVLALHLKRLGVDPDVSPKRRWAADDLEGLVAAHAEALADIETLRVLISPRSDARLARVLEALVRDHQQCLRALRALQALRSEPPTPAD
jgi:hypothetical protein